MGPAKIASFEVDIQPQLWIFGIPVSIWTPECCFGHSRELLQTDVTAPMLKTDKGSGPIKKYYSQVQGMVPKRSNFVGTPSYMFGFCDKIIAYLTEVNMIVRCDIVFIMLHLKCIT